MATRPVRERAKAIVKFRRTLAKAERSEAARKQFLRREAARDKKRRAGVDQLGRTQPPTPIEEPNGYVARELASAQDRTEIARRSDRQRLHSAFWHEIGPSPTCGPGETEIARAFVRKIDGAMDRGGWTRSEQAHLSRLRKTWLKRANGDDARFMIVGTAKGKVSPGDKLRIDAWKDGLR